MLTELKISNFAIIEAQSVHFGAGLNVISGETGSGKSILLNALELILGARPRTHFIREGAEQLEIEGHFDLTRIGASILEELPHIAQGDELVLYRSMSRSGKGKVYINGRIGTVSLLEEIAQKLINICGQGQQMRLLNPSFHIGLVDEYAGHSELLSEYQTAFAKHQQLEKKLSEMSDRKRFADHRQVELEDIIAELGACSLHAGVRAELEAKVKKLESAEKLIDGSQRILATIGEDEGLLPQFSNLHSKLHELMRWDSELKKYVEQVQTLRVNFQELESDLMQYVHSIDLDQALLEDLRNELALVARLERKYRTNDSGLVELLNSAKLELAELGKPEQETKLREECDKAAVQAEKLAARLTSSRCEAGERLMKAVQADLRDVNMAEAKLKLEIEPCEATSQGSDRLEFLISSNRGELYKPLRQIASGGELSRIMLVLKKNLRDRSGVNVLVFDEVDAGISGAVARAVGEKVKSLSQLSQVICITHLAQIASLADRHILVDKKVGVRTVSQIRVLKEEEKIDEIARMLAGYQITKAARESAKELLSSK